MRTNRVKQLKKFKVIFWLIYLAIFSVFYVFVLQVKLPTGAPDDFLQVMIVVLAGSCAAIVMIILGIIVGLLATVKSGN